MRGYSSRCYGNGLSSFHPLLYIFSVYQFFVSFLSLTYMHSGSYEPRQRTSTRGLSRQPDFIPFVRSITLSTHSSPLCIFLSTPSLLILHIFVIILPPFQSLPALQHVLSSLLYCLGFPAMVHITMARALRLPKFLKPTEKTTISLSTLPAVAISTDDPSPLNQSHKSHVLSKVMKGTGKRIKKLFTRSKKVL